MIRTSRIGYCDGIDITVKSCAPEWRGLTPTWEMVMQFKSGCLSKGEYTRRYLSLLESPAGRDAVLRLVDHVREHGYVVLLCYCRPGAFCHRILLAQHLEQFGLPYDGEVRLEDSLFEPPPTT